MIKDKEIKEEILKELMSQMGNRVYENDLKPKKTKMVIKASGDNPEEVKEKVIEKLQSIELPSEEDMKDMEESMPEEDEMMEEEGEDDFLDELPEGLRKALSKKMK